MYLISQGDMVRISNYLKKEIIEASKEAFGECEIVLFGSRVDDSKKGGDFDIAIKKDIDYKEFQKKKIKFFKYLILKDLDLPIDLILYNKADSFLKKEIDRGVELKSV